MKTAALAVIVTLISPIRSLDAACKSDACKKAIGWKNGYTAVVLADDITDAGYHAVLDAVKAENGVVAIEADGVLLGWLPKPAANRLRSVRGVRAIFYDVAPRPDDLVRNENARSVLAFYNRVLAGEFEDAIERGLAVSGAPLTGCVVPRGAGPSAESLEHLSSGVAPSADGRLVVAESENSTPTGGELVRTSLSGKVSTHGLYPPYRNPSMRGRVSVQMFRLDSDGTVDANLYTWTQADFQYARDQVYGAFTFWANQAAARSIPLSFRVETSDQFSRYTRAFVATRTKYEPITRPIAQDYLWVNDALAMQGYGATPVTAANVFERNEAFNQYRASTAIGAPYDRSFTVYIVYNPAPASTTFADGYRAYAYYDGPYTMMMWDSGGWGPSNIGKVLTHETGHIFWACDEYYDAATNTGCYTCDHCQYDLGPRNQVVTPWIRNPNCAYPGSACAMPRAPCVMDEDISYALCAHTPAQIGW